MQSNNIPEEMEAMLIVHEFLTLDSLTECRDGQNDALDIITNKLKHATGMTFEIAVFEQTKSRGNKALLSILFNKTHDNDRALIDNLAYKYCKNYACDLYKEIKSLKSLNICPPFTYVELDIIKRYNKKMHEDIYDRI
jgi:hypothetical protein